MKLSDLLLQKRTIDAWNVTPELLELSNKLSQIRDNIDKFGAGEHLVEADLVSNDIDDILNDVTSLVEHINETQATAHDLMQELAKEPLGDSYDMYDESKNWFNQEQAQKCRDLDQFADDSVAAHKFNTLIRKFSSWQYPTLYVRPNSLRFFDAMKATSILYVAEQCDITNWLKENLEDGLYNEIRFKAIDENKEQFLTNSIPSGQVGLIVMEHFMHFKPLDVIKQYLTESFELLKPGGHLMFTYNNCDLPAGARLFESGNYCFTPGAMLEKICECYDFKIIDAVATDSVSWLALKKPGELTSIKSGKTVGEIKRDPIVKPEYDPTRSIEYNKKFNQKP